MYEALILAMWKEAAKEGSLPVLAVTTLAIVAGQFLTSRENPQSLPKIAKPSINLLSLFSFSNRKTSPARNITQAAREYIVLVTEQEAEVSLVQAQLEACKNILSGYYKAKKEQLDHLGIDTGLASITTKKFAEDAFAKQIKIMLLQNLLTTYPTPNYSSPSVTDIDNTIAARIEHHEKVEAALKDALGEHAETIKKLEQSNPQSERCSLRLRGGI